MADQSANVELPDPVEITLRPASYQPSKAEMEEEFDMPGMSLGEIRSTFFRPDSRLNEFEIAPTMDGCLQSAAIT